MAGDITLYQSNYRLISICLCVLVTFVSVLYAHEVRSEKNLYTFSEGTLLYLRGHNMQAIFCLQSKDIMPL